MPEAIDPICPHGEDHEVCEVVCVCGHPCSGHDDGTCQHCWCLLWEEQP